MASNQVNDVSVVASTPTLTQPRSTVKVSGSSDITFTFAGEFTNGAGNLVVVLRASANCDARTAQVNANSNGGIFTLGATGVFCEITTDTRDGENWTVMASSGTDRPGTGMTFVAGTGGGGH